MNFLTMPVLYGLAAAAIGAGVFAGVQTVRLANEKADHSSTKAEHAKVLQTIAEQTAETARLAAIARDTFDDEVMSGLVRHAKEVDNAFERGRKHGAAIAAGTERVRTVWRGRECPKAAAGSGTEPAAGIADVDPGRAEAIGEILGLGGSFDADYSAAFERLKSAQGLLNACYDEPAKPLIH